MAAFDKRSGGWTTRRCSCISDYDNSTHYDISTRQISRERKKRGGQLRQRVDDSNLRWETKKDRGFERQKQRRMVGMTMMTLREAAQLRRWLIVITDQLCNENSAFMCGVWAVSPFGLYRYILRTIGATGKGNWKIGRDGNSERSGLRQCQILPIICIRSRCLETLIIVFFSYDRILNAHARLEAHIQIHGQQLLVITNCPLS